MKFFIGIVPPLDLNEKIFDFQRSFPSNKVPYFHKPHITLKAPNGLTEDIAWLEKVKMVVGDQSVFEIKMEGLDNFEDRVLFLKPAYSKDLIDLHLKLVSLLCPDIETDNKFFEGPVYHPHLTLGETTWGEMTKEELVLMKKRAESELSNIPSFKVYFVRVFKKERDGEPYQKFIDIPLKS